jgi:hypothetical protein
LEPGTNSVQQVLYFLQANQLAYFQSDFPNQANCQLGRLFYKVLLQAEARDGGGHHGEGHHGHHAEHSQPVGV